MRLNTCKLFSISRLLPAIVAAVALLRARASRRLPASRVEHRPLCLI